MVGRHLAGKSICQIGSTRGMLWEFADFLMDSEWVDLFGARDKMGHLGGMIDGFR